MNASIKEPKTSLLMRIAIVNYEIGDLTKNIAYAERFPDSQKVFLALAKADLADSLVQLKLLCNELGYDFNEVMSFGEEKLVERYKDFEKKGWQDK
jgi:hypothetical protein